MIVFSSKNCLLSFNAILTLFHLNLVWKRCLVKIDKNVIVLLSDEQDLKICVDDGMKKVSDDNDDNVSVYIFVRQFTVFFWHPLLLLYIIYVYIHETMIVSFQQLYVIDEEKCGRVMFILESSIPNKMNNIYSSERLNELKKSVLHFQMKIKYDDITSFISLWITKIIYNIHLLIHLMTNISLSLYYFCKVHDMTDKSQIDHSFWWTLNPLDKYVYNWQLDEKMTINYY
jgi:hypothetical protein